MQVRGNTTLVGVDWRARLIDKSLTIGALVLLLSVLYLILIGLLAPRLDTAGARTGHTIAAVLVAMLVVPIRNRLGQQINRVMRRKWQSSQELLREVGPTLSSTISPEGLYQILVADLPQRLHIQGATLWMLEPPTDHAFVVVGRYRDSIDTMLLANGAIARHLNATPNYLIVPDGADADTDWAPMLNQDVHLAIPLRVGERLIGVYGCAMPQSGNRYSPRVINTLLMLAPSIATALENARAYTKIARLNEELRALDKLKDEFIQSVGHELRTPLTSLSLAMQLLTRQSDMPPALSHVTHVGVAQLQALVERVLEFDLRLTPSPNEQQASVAPILLGPLLEMIVEEYTPIGAAKGMRLKTQIPPDLAALGHAPRLHRALHEVVDNAVRYSQGGTVTIKAVLYDGLAVVSISDEGPGIPYDERDRLFTAFYRGSGARALSATPGAGLGLSIAQRDIESLGGQIWLERSGPSGSTMCVALPSAISDETLFYEEQRVRMVGA
jgi:signal transduction histidine kinase